MCLNRSGIGPSRFGLNKGMRVQILASAGNQKKVRVLTNDRGDTFVKDDEGLADYLADPRIGSTCWVAGDFLK